jgi:beta-galactosidase
MNLKLLSKYILIIVLISACSQQKDFDNTSLTKKNYDFSNPDFLPISVWYSGGKARAPMLSEITSESRLQWKHDLEQIKELGFNTVRTWVEWAHCEPKAGVYQFDNLHILADLAQEIGLKFIIQLYLDSAPDWVGKKYPDGLYETQSGAKVKSQAAPGFCSDHPGVRISVQDFITEVAKVASQYPNFHGWDLWSEPHIVNWAYINYVPNVQFCFCPNTQRRFRIWLKDKYKTITALNNAWYRNFEGWEDIEPPRFGTILSYTDFIDWKNFLYFKLADDLAMRYAAVRRADKTHVITSHAAVPSIYYTPYYGYGAADDFLMAEQVDYYGTSLYPKHNHPSKHWEIWKFMLAVDFSRCANKNNRGFYVGELQAGKGTYGLNIGNPITPGDHRVWMWSAIAKGAKAINIYAYYPMSSGYESGGYGLVNLDGSITERAKQAGMTAQIIHNNRDLFLKSQQAPAKIAIVYNPLAQMVGGEQRHSGRDMHQLSLFGYYRALAENNIPVDFIHRLNLENGSLGQYKLIIVPYPLMFSQEAADGLKDFIKKGGYVVLEARPGWNDERGFASAVIPGMGLSAVLGIKERTVRMMDDVPMNLFKYDHPLSFKIKPSKKLMGAYFVETFDILDKNNVTIIARLADKSSSIVESQFGFGKALLIGSFIGMATHQGATENVQFILNMLRWADIELPYSTSGRSPVELRLQNYDAGYILYLINHGTSEDEVTVDLKVDRAGTYILNELITGKSSVVYSQTNNIHIEHKLNRRDVCVMYIKLK